MVENPNNPILALDVQKMQTWIAPSKLMYQGDQGYNQPFRLTNGWNAYDISPENLCFSASKPDGQIIEVENEPDRFVEKEGVWYFKLPDEVTQAVGFVTCFFYVKDSTNGISASTTKFSYSIEAKFNDEERSTSYVSILERLQHIFETYVENAKTEVNKLNLANDQYQTRLTAMLNEFQNQVNKWIIDKKNEVDNTFNERKTLFDNLDSQLQSKYNGFVKNWSDQITNQQETWQSNLNKANDAANSQRSQFAKSFNEQKNSFNNNYEQFKATALTDLVKKRDEKLKEIDNDWAVKKNSLQNDINSFKEQLTNQLSEIVGTVNNLKNTELPNLTERLELTKREVEDLSSRLSNINFDLYETKEESNSKLSQKADKTEVQELNSKIDNVNQNTSNRISALENAGYTKYREGFSSAEEARKWSADNHGVAYFNDGN